jgi:hypothetical protein
MAQLNIARGGSHPFAPLSGDNDDTIGGRMSFQLCQLTVMGLFATLALALARP